MSLVLVNGVVVGAANVSTVIGGVVVTGIKSIDLKMSQKKENVMGLQQQPVGRGRAQYDYAESTLEILLEEWKAIVAAAPNRDPMQIPMFDIPIVYDNNVLPQETVSNVEFTSVGRSYKGGDAALWLTVNFIYAGLNQ